MDISISIIIGAALAAAICFAARWFLWHKK
jgi:hypothetical protein